MKRLIIIGLLFLGLGFIPAWAQETSHDFNILELKSVENKGEKYLLCKYETNIDLTNRSELVKEIERLWKQFKSNAIESGETKAVIRAARTAKEGEKTKSVDFVFTSNKDLVWSCKDSSIKAGSLVEDNMFFLDVNRKKLSDKQILAIYNRIEKEEPNNFFVLLDRSFFYQKRKKDKKADQYFKKALKASTGDSLALGNIGNYYFVKQEYPKALKYYDKCLSKDPNNTTGLVGRSAAYIETKEFKKALVAANEALEIDRNLPSAFHNKGEALFEMKQYAWAIQALTAALKIDPELGETYYFRSKALNMLGKEKLAAKDLAKSKELKYVPD